MNLLMGIDVGSTSIKSVVFDTHGKELSSAKKYFPTKKQSGGHIERNLYETWDIAVDVIKQSLQKDNVLSSKIDVIGVTGAGDGLILLDKDGKPVRNGITSLDTRAADIIKKWIRTGTAEKMFPLIGEIPYSGTPVALLRWIKQNEADNYRKASFILFVKDWIKYKLTGTICTDQTDASATLTDFDGSYQKTIFENFGIKECYDKTVPIIDSKKIAGYITLHTSKLTGLKQGTPVISGIHDCSASSLGSGCIQSGQTCIIVGSWSGNQVVMHEPFLDEGPKKHWMIRNYILPESWILINASPASAVNLDWFLKMYGNDNLQNKYKNESSLYAVCNKLVEKARCEEIIIYHPFLYGSQLNPHASAGFYGLRPWHKSEDLLRALYEGIAFNHSLHLSEFEGKVRMNDFRICGGGSQSNVWMQIFADAINHPIKILKSSQASALGVSIAAGVGVGIFTSFKEACSKMVLIDHGFEPIPENVKVMKAKRDIYKTIYKQMLPGWEMMNKMQNNLSKCRCAMESKNNNLYGGKR